MTLQAVRVKSQNNQEYSRKDSPFEMIINSQALNRLQSIHVKSENNEKIEIKVQLQVHGDYRKHWVKDSVYSPEEACFLINTLIECHSKQHSEDAYEMEIWHQTLNDTSQYYGEGLSVFLGSV